MIEYGVLWDETGEVEPCDSRRAAEVIVALHSWDGYVVTRTVTCGPWIELRDLDEARRSCEAARWPEQHRDDCVWCAHVAASTGVQG